MAESILDIVNEDDEISGSAPRSQIHKDGLLHREIHVWIITKDGKLVLQKRSPTKDTFPNLMDVSVGGHVEQGCSYADAALMELSEEAGINADFSELSFWKKDRGQAFDHVTNMHNNVFRAVYVYRFDGTVNDLRVEDNDGGGFHAITLDDALNPPAELQAQTIPDLLQKYHELFLSLT